MDSDSRKAIRNVGLVLIGLGLLQALVISTFSHDPAILSFGFGPSLVGLFIFTTSFFKMKQPKNPFPMWRNAALSILTIALWLPRLFFGYHFPGETHFYILIAYPIVAGLLLLWPVKDRPAQESQNPFAGGGVISN